MKKQQLFFLIAVMMMICFGCKKDSDSADFASSAVGIYEGNWDAYGGNYYGTCEVSKVTNTTIKLTMEILGVSIPEIPDVKLSDDGSGKIKLSYSDPSGTVTGSIQGKTIHI